MRGLLVLGFLLVATQARLDPRLLKQELLPALCVAPLPTDPPTTGALNPLGAGFARGTVPLVCQLPDEGFTSTEPLLAEVLPAAAAGRGGGLHHWRLFTRSRGR